MVDTLHGSTKFGIMDNFNVMPSIAKEQNPIKMKNINSWNAQVTFNL
jgi:hypothetical protein